jgi:biotin transport system substrate-specific component
MPSGRRVLSRTERTTRRVAAAPAVELPSRITLPVRLSARMSRSLDPTPVEPTATISSCPTCSAGVRPATRSAQLDSAGVGVGVSDPDGAEVGDAVVGAADGVRSGVLAASGIGVCAHAPTSTETSPKMPSRAVKVRPMSSISVSPRTLADVIPGGLVRSITLVAGGAIFVGLTAQVVIPLWFTPVPLSLQTFSVLLVGAALGSTRGAASMGLYLLAGIAGVPWFADQNSGWQFASIGYVVGFVAAAWLVGLLAERRGDRTPVRAAALMVLGNLAIYLFGVTGLVLMTPFDLPTAIAKGVVPFLLGDAIKIVAAAALLPAAWKLVGSRRS